MNILVINCGSSSLKYQLIDMKNETLLAKGLVERIGNEGSVLSQKAEGKEKYIINIPMKDHNDATSLVIGALTDEKYGAIKSMSEINAVGHRVVHGGEFYSESVKIDSTVKKAIANCIKLAPLHNPANLIGINACEALMPTTPMVAVFDTAFHQTLPDFSYIYPIPYEFYTKNRIRKYGFHGTSHEYVSRRAAEILSKDIKDLKMITCHIGNGSSITAIKNGKSIDTSMGFTPLDGLAMGTRCGGIDPSIVIYLQSELKLSIDEVENILNKKSGLLGLSGVSSDFRDVIKANKEGNPRAKLALEVFYNRIKSDIGSYVAILGGLDCLVFTAGIGENSREFREAICDGLEFLGINLDKDKNNIAGIERIISVDSSKVKILVVPTNEELMIARDTKNIIDKL